MEDIDKWRRAGKIAAEAREYGKSLIRNGASILEVSEKIEKKITDLGAGIAFPAQISLDHVAAHYTPDPGDKIVFDNNLVKLDIGTHIDGYIGDTACTIDLSGKYSDLVKSAEQALKSAIRAVEEGRTIGEIGKAIHETISSYGYAPIRNLSGHGLSQYTVHDKPTVPNFDTRETETLHHQVIAIEPFATTGRGLIQDSGNANIFSVIRIKPVRNPMSRKLLEYLHQYNGMPFATRWLRMPMVNFALRELRQLDIIRDYPPLPEITKGMVSQAEHTVLIGDKIEVLTL